MVIEITTKQIDNKTKLCSGSEFYRYYLISFVLMTMLTLHVVTLNEIFNQTIQFRRCPYNIFEVIVANSKKNRSIITIMHIPIYNASIHAYVNGYIYVRNKIIEFEDIHHQQHAAGIRKHKNNNNASAIL